MKKKFLILGFTILAGVSAITISQPAFACSTYCLTKCSVMPNFDMWSACMYGCCPPAN